MNSYVMFLNGIPLRVNVNNDCNNVCEDREDCIDVDYEIIKEEAQTQKENIQELIDKLEKQTRFQVVEEEPKSQDITN